MSGSRDKDIILNPLALAEPFVAVVNLAPIHIQNGRLEGKVLMEQIWKKLPGAQFFANAQKIPSFAFLAR